MDPLQEVLRSLMRSSLDRQYCPRLHQKVRGSSPWAPPSVWWQTAPVMFRAATVLCVLALLSAGCDGQGDGTTTGPAPAVETAATETPTYSALVEPAAAVLALVPVQATVLTVTDFDQIRLQLGVPDLTSQDPMADRNDFWRRAETEAALLNDGMLRDENSQLMLDYGFTQDDVDWEAHFTGPSGNGYVLGFRPDLDMAVVQKAVGDGVGELAAAEVSPNEHLVTVGTTDNADQSWGADPALTALVGPPADSTYVERSCVPIETALGDVDPAGDEAAAEREKLSQVDELGAFSVSFEGELATARLGVERRDLFDRLALGDDWPASDPAFGDGFAGGAADPASGRLGYEMVSAPRAAQLALTRTLPFAVCSQA